MVKTKRLTCIRSWRILLLFSLIFCVGIGAVYGSNPGQPLFAGLAEDTLFSSDVQSRMDLEKQNPAIERSRYVQINFNVLSELDRGRTKWAESIVLNLFDDVTLTAYRDRVERRSSESVSWFGRIEGFEKGQVILVVRDGNITGNVR